MKLNNFYLSRVLYFLCIYVTLLSTDLFVMIYIYITQGVIYWKSIIFKEAFIATLIFFIPVTLVQFLLYTQSKKKQIQIKHTQPKKQKKWKKQKNSKG